MSGLQEADRIIEEGAWKGFPVRLRDMLISLHSGDGPYDEPAEVIEYLTGALETAAGRGWELAASRLSWVDEFFTNCFDPVYHEGSWRCCSSSALRLVRDAEALLIESRPEVESPLDRDELPETGVLDLRCLRQDLNAFGCVASGFAGDEDAFLRRLDSVVEDNELNVRLEAEQSRALFQGDAEPGSRYVECFSGSRLWTDILAYVAHAAPYMGLESEAAEAYRRYISYLLGAIQWGAPLVSSLVAAKTEHGRLESFISEDSSAARSRLALDGRCAHAESFPWALVELGPEYPLDFSATEEVKRVIDDNPGLPIVVFAGPEGTDGAYCEIDRVDVTQALNVKTHWWPFATVATSRSELVGAIENEIRDIGCVEGFEPDWNDEQIAAAAEKEAAKLDGGWVPVIAIRATWKELRDVPF